MIRKLLILGINCINAALLVFMISLGSQNLSTRHRINLGLTSTDQFPSGFLIGMSIVLGSLSGTFSSTVLTKTEDKNFPRTDH